MTTGEAYVQESRSETGGSQPTYFDGIKMSNKQKTFMILLIAGTFVEQMDLYNFAMISPALIKVWGISMADVGHILAAFGIGAVVGCLFFGWVADNKGRKLAMGSALILAGLTAVLAAFSPNLNFLIAVRVLAGAGIAGALSIETNFLIEMVPSDKRSRYQGILAIVAISGVPLSVTLAKTLLVNPANWWIVALLPSLAIVVGILFFLFVPESPRWLVSKGRVEEGKKQFKNITGQELKIDPDFHCIVEKASYGEALKVIFSQKYAKRTVLFVTLCIILVNAGFLFMQWLPTLLVKEGMTLAQATKYQQMVTIAMLFGPLYVILFGDKGGRKIPYVIALFIIASGLVIVSQAGVANIKLLTIGVLIAGAFYITNQAFYSVYLGECYPTKVRAIVTAVIGLCQRLSQVFANGVVAPWLYAAAGFSGYFKTLAIVYILMSLMILWLGPRTAGKTLEELNS